MFVINNWNSTDSNSTIPVVRYDLSPFHSCPPHCMITVIILSDIHFPKFLVMLQCIQKYMYIMCVYIFFLKKLDHREVKSFFASTYSFHVHYWTGNVINEQDWGVVECVYETFSHFLLLWLARMFPIHSADLVALPSLWPCCGPSPSSFSPAEFFSLVNLSLVCSVSTIAAAWIPTSRAYSHWWSKSV